MPVKGCGHNSTSEKGKYRFFRIPKVVENQGEQTKLMCEERRRQWIANIYRGDLKAINLEYTQICSDHFVSGKVFLRFYLEF